ncbi:MAG: DUF5667 domain-containing protein [Patescibacteria group bacterium]|jgi:hypothetical protein
MKYFIVFAFFLFVSIASVSAQDTVESADLGDAGLTPSSPFYLLDSWGEGIQGLFIRDPEQRALFDLERANERLVELQKICDSEKAAETCKRWTERLTHRFEKHMERAQGQLERFAEQKGIALRDEIADAADTALDEATTNQGVDALVDTLSSHAVRHQETLQQLYEQVPEEQKEYVVSTMEGAADGLVKTFDRVRQSHKAIELQEQLGETAESLRAEAGETVRTRLMNTGLFRVKQQLQNTAEDIQQRAQDIVTDELAP